MAIGDCMKRKVVSVLGSTSVREASHPVLLGVIIWVTVAVAALVDNVPIIIAMISFLKGLSAVGVNVSALWWGGGVWSGFRR